MKQEDRVICEYEDSWKVIKTQNGLIVRENEEPDTLVKEVYRFQPGEYEDKDVAELEQIVQEKGIDFDYCGELDDCSGYVFWSSVRKITIVIRDGILTDVRIPLNIDLEIEALQIDKDYPDYEQLREFEDEIYADTTMRSADFTSIRFEE